MAVLIVAGAEDPQGRRVRAELRARGVETVLFDAPAYPERGQVSLSEAGVLLNRRALPAVRAAYVRALRTHPLSPGFEEDLQERPRGLVAQCDEKRALLESLLLRLEARGVRLVNGLEANAQHDRKPLQLARLGAAGVPIPRWVATNDPREVRRFAREVGDVVYKPLAGGATARRLTRKDLSRERMDALRAAPVLFQAYVPGVSVRAYVVGRRVVAAAEIHSEELDYRRGETAVVATRMSALERRDAVRAARVCGMSFAGVDLLRGERESVVLECNPSPMFAVFEEKTGLDVAGPLAEMLGE